MEPDEYETIARVEDKHWWYRGMAAISLALLASQVRAISKQIGKPPKILDAGCGPGGMFKTLRKFGSATGIDLHPLALQFAKLQAPVSQATVERLPFCSSCFHIVTSFDVLYHLAVHDDRQALSEFYRILQPGGLLLIRVPALKRLGGAHDRHVHTRERYSANLLETRLHAAGFRLKRLTYANFFLLPLVFLRRRLQANDETATDVELPAGLINNLLEKVLLLESWLVSFISFPIGVSLFALAYKPETNHAP